MRKSITSAKYRSLLKWLREQRLACDMSMRDLAERLNEPHTFIAKIESAERRLDVFEYVTYCEALGLDPHEGIKLLIY